MTYQVGNEEEPIQPPLPELTPLLNTETRWDWIWGFLTAAWATIVAMFTLHGWYLAFPHWWPF